VRLRLWHVLIFLFFTLLLASTLQAQNRPNELLPEARFFVDLQKHSTHGPYQKVYSWESNIGLETRVYRRHSQAFDFQFNVQTAGAPYINKKVNIAGTSYTLGFFYLNQLNKNTSVSFGLTHLSSHLSEDELKIIDQERRRGVAIPAVKFNDVNVISTEVTHHFAWKQLEPVVHFRFQPVDIKLRGGYRLYEEPVWLATQLKLWGNDSKTLLFLTQHEFGERPLNDGILRLDLVKPEKKEEGRLQFLFGYSPGHGLHADPNTGWHKEGFSVKMRFVFLAH